MVENILVDPMLDRAATRSFRRQICAADTIFGWYSSGYFFITVVSFKRVDQMSVGKMVFDHKTWNQKPMYVNDRKNKNMAWYNYSTEIMGHS